MDGIKDATVKFRRLQADKSALPSFLGGIKVRAEGDLSGMSEGASALRFSHTISPRDLGEIACEIERESCFPLAYMHGEKTINYWESHELGK